MQEKIKTSRIIYKKRNNTHFKLALNYYEDFLPGQVIEIYTKKDSKFLDPRPYTLISLNQKAFELFIGIVPNGKYSNKLSKLKVGDKIYFKGPLGTPITERIKKNKLLIIALGSGITTYRKFINEDKKHNITLFQINKEKDPFFNNEFLDLEKENNNFHYKEIISSEEKPTDYIEKEIKEINPKEFNFLISGPPKGVEFYSSFLIEKGINKEEIILD